MNSMDFAMRLPFTVIVLVVAVRAGPFAGGDTEWIEIRDNLDLAVIYLA